MTIFREPMTMERFAQLSEEGYLLVGTIEEDGEFLVSELPDIRTHPNHGLLALLDADRVDIAGCTLEAVSRVYPVALRITERIRQRMIELGVEP